MTLSKSYCKIDILRLKLEIYLLLPLLIFKLTNFTVCQHEFTSVPFTMLIHYY